MRVLILCAFAVVSGCFNPVYDAPQCSPEGECPAGLACVGGVCRAMGSEIDAAVADAPVPDAIAIDAPDGAPADANVGECNPLDQTSCPAGWKCTGVQDGAGEAIGPRCVPDGTLGVDAACVSNDQVLDETGWRHDDCVAGAMCISGTCADFCQTEPDSCSANRVCALYSVWPGDAVGICAPSCDPVTQVRSTDGAVACGSTDPADPNLQCIGQVNGPFMCAPNLSQANTHGVLVTPPVYLNSCAAGFAPYFPAPDGSGSARCAAFCRPQATSQGNTAGRFGVPGSGYTCPDRGATAAECRFISFIQDGSQPGFGDYDDVGICFDYTIYNTCGGGTDPCPSCTTLSSGNTDYGCAPL